MHPWYGVGVNERIARRNEFKHWLKTNADKRLHAGQKRDDGKVFIGYGCGYANGEHWTAEATWLLRKQHSAKQMRKLRQTQEYRDKFNAYMRKRTAERADVRAKVALRGKKHRLEKPEMNRAKSMRRYAIKLNATLACHDAVKEAELHRQATRLTAETGVKHHVDHIIPLAAGGWHHHDNMQVIPLTVNVQKAKDPFWTSDVYKDWRSVPSWLWPDYLADAYLDRLYRAA